MAYVGYMLGRGADGVDAMAYIGIKVDNEWVHAALITITYITCSTQKKSGSPIQEPT
jgi:hypothetical protein